MEFLEDQIIKVTENVWKTVIGLDVKVVDADLGPEKEQIASFVQISGAWEGTVIMDCDKELSRLLTSLMFNKPKDDINDQDILDALGEFVNIIAGNLKAYLPQPCQLSLPAAIGGWDYTLRFPGSQKVSQIVFEYGSAKFFEVTVLKRGESLPFTKVVKQA